MAMARKYRRVSTDEQAASGFSLDAQLAKINDFCNRRGYAPAGDYCDDGYSAKSLDRPAIQRLLREAKPGDIIVVYKLDRLTRSAKDLEYLLELSEKREIYFQSATEDIETASPAGRLFVRMLIQFAQFERETIAQRSSMGRRQKALSGFWSGSVPPFGYMLVDSDEVKRGRVLKRLAPDPLTRHVVPMIFERYLAGYGARTIAAWLNSEVNVRTSAGNRFNATAVTWILRNPAYVGDSMVRKKRKAVAERVPGTHEALVEREIFDAVQRLYDVRAALPPRVATGLFPLAGIAYCGVCGGKIAGSNERMVVSGKRTDQRYRIYRCYNRATGRGCGVKPFSSVSADIIEAAFLSEMERFITTNDDFDDFFAACQGDAESHADTIRSEIRRLNDEIADVRQAISVWDVKLERKRIDDDEHEEKVAPHRERLKATRERLQALEAQIPRIVDKEAMKATFVSLRDSWAGLDAPARKVLVQHLVAEFPIQIRLYPGRRVVVAPLHDAPQSQAGE